MSLADQEVYLFPLSSPQRRLWFVDQLEPGMPWNVPIVFRLIGPLNLRALRQSFAEIISRHEVLRTTFAVVDGEPMQIIAPELNIEIPLVQINGGPEEQREIIKRVLWTPFDLAAGPLLRASVLRVNEEEHILAASIHHIVFDGWSMGLFFREFAECYEAFNANRAPELPQLPLQYADFAVWQREMLQGGHLDEHLSFWKRQFADPPPELEFAFDWRPVAGQRSRGGSRHFEFDPALSSALKAFSQREGVTLFMTLLAAYQVVLYRYTRETDIVVGCPTANRNRTELQDLMGCFMNPLPIRTTMSDEMTFRQLLARVREVALGAYSYQDLPFDVLVNAVQTNRRSALPLFQAMFIFQNFTDTGLHLQTLKAVPVKPDLEVLLYPVLLMMGEKNDRLAGYVEYAVDRYGTILSRLPDHLMTLLSAVVADADAPISKLPILTAGERQRLLKDWNQTERHYPEADVHELFEAQVRQHPESIALVHEAEALTYAQLNQRANRLAHHLRAKGIGPGTIAGVALERSIDLITALLAVFKAGGAYVPLDLTYPKDRLRLMLENSGVALVITVTSARAHLPEQDAPIVCLDTEQTAIDACSEVNPARVGTSEDLAYVIYTSGSTGRPKGVMVERRSLSNYTHVACGAFETTRADRVLQFASISFDTAAEEIFPCLASGATLVLRSESMIDSVEEFIDQTRQRNLTVIDLPTAFWHELVRVMESEGLRLPASLRLVIIGGERALPERVAVWQHVAPGIRLLNTYGPTETTIVATMCDLTADGNPSVRDAPIGRPVGNVEAYVLSPSLELVPIGFAGELCIGGAGMARGYLGQPELTAETFVRHPFHHGKRLYRTGDRVRYLPDGNLQYLGRIDNQVKLRGFRIELQEIETVLRSYAGVSDVVVTADELEPGQKRLVAYVVASGQKRAAVGDLRAHLKEVLPDFMVPGAFVFLDRFPLLPNGKVDRRSLPKPEQTTAATETFVEPRTDVEKILAEIWAKVLRVERVGLTDNFFELGGDSILSIQIVAKAARAGLRVTPRDLFQHQTIGELAGVVTIGRITPSEQGLVAGEVPLLPSQRAFLIQDWPDPQHFTQAVLLEVKTPCGEELLREALAAVASHHDALRLRFVRETAVFRQFYGPFETTLPFSTIDLSGTAPGLRQAALNDVTTRIQHSLNLETGPLWRAALLNLGEQGLRLFWVIHHLVVDGVSWRILVEDLGTALEQLRTGKAVQLPPKTTSLRQWSEQLHAYGRAGVIRKELEYWMTDASQRAARVPVDTRGQTNTFASTDTLSVELGVEETRLLLQKIPQLHKTQVNEVLLTGLIEALRQWTQGSRFSVRLEGHGREDLLEGIDLSRTVGWFTTFFPVFFDVAESSKPIETLRCVKEQLRRVPNKGIALSLAYLTEDADVLSRLSALQPPEISFNYLGQFDQAMNDSSWFAVAKEDLSAVRSSHATRNALLEINGSVVNGRLQVIWTYSRNFHRKDTIHRVADSFLGTLRALVRNEDRLAPGYIPSDFSEFGWNQQDLNDILAEIEPS